jgi:RNA recognition motif. (a.k.a. RRM, RBD, or RNP domain)
VVHADPICSSHSATKQDIEDHFNSQGTGKITEIKLMNGFGFIEYEDALDARDIVPGKKDQAENDSNLLD